MYDYIPRETIFHRSLIEVKMIGGVQTNLAIMNFIICGVFVESLHVLWFPIVTFALHMFLKWVTKKDPLILDIFNMYRHQGDHYDPWPRSHQEQGERPVGFGKGMLC